MLKEYSDKLDNVNIKVVSIVKDILDSNKNILTGLEECNKELLVKAKENLKNMGARAVEIDNMVLKILALYAPEATDLRLVLASFKIINELLRASSNTRTFISGLSTYCSELDEKDFRDLAIPMQKSTIECLSLIVDMLNSTTNEEIESLHQKVIVAESKTNEYYEVLQDSIYKKNLEKLDFDKYNKILRAFRKSEKIGDRALDIAALIHFAKIGGELGAFE